LASLSGVKGLVVVVEGTVDASLRETARTHRLSILEAPTAQAARRAVLCLHPRAIVVQVSRLTGEALNLIRLTAGLDRSVAVVAIATAHTDEVERAVREAGATWYLADVASCSVDSVLAAVVSQEN
jgi:DNA-binding response OmpR family regulator